MNKFLLRLLLLVLPSSAAEEPVQATVRLIAIPKEDIVGYLSGAGMGMAKVADHNLYPGPVHVLAFSEELGLTDEQVEQAQELYLKMKNKAARLGAEMIVKETLLQKEFANKTVSQSVLRELVSTASRLKGEIRYTHLEAHIQQRKLLTEHQIQLYSQLRNSAEFPHHGNHH